MVVELELDFLSFVPPLADTLSSGKVPVCLLLCYCLFLYEFAKSHERSCSSRTKRHVCLLELVQFLSIAREGVL